MQLEYSQAEKSQLEIEIPLNGVPNALLFSKVLKHKIYTAKLLNCLFVFSNKYICMT